MNINTLIITILGTTLFSSCATKFTPAQREALATISVATTTVGNKAYSAPNGGDRSSASAGGLAGVGSGTGAIGGIVGALVGESIAATQNGIFKGKSSQHFTAVEANTPSLVEPVTNTLKTDLKEDAFFGPRLRDHSANQITSEVVSYGLVRSGKGDDSNLLLTPQVVIKFALKDNSGKNLAGNTYLGTGYNHPITKYASDSAETKKGYSMAIQLAVDQFTSELAQKTAE